MKKFQKQERSWVESGVDNLMESIQMRHPWTTTFRLARAVVALATLGAITKMAGSRKRR